MQSLQSFLSKFRLLESLNAEKNWSMFFLLLYVLLHLNNVRFEMLGDSMVDRVLLVQRFGISRCQFSHLL